MRKILSVKMIAATSVNVGVMRAAAAAVSAGVRVLRCYFCIRSSRRCRMRLCEALGRRYVKYAGDAVHCEGVEGVSVRVEAVLQSLPPTASATAVLVDAVAMMYCR